MVWVRVDVGNPDGSPLVGLVSQASIGCFTKAIRLQPVSVQAGSLGPGLPGVGLKSLGKGHRGEKNTFFYS